MWVVGGTSASKHLLVRKCSDPSSSPKKMSFRRNLRSLRRFFRNKIVLTFSLITVSAFFYLYSLSGDESTELDDLENRVYRRSLSDKGNSIEEGVVDLNFMIGTSFKQGVNGHFEPEPEVARTGPGENGKPVEGLSQEDPKVKTAQLEFGFNTVASDMVSLNRSIPDTRPTEYNESATKYWEYPLSLPKASVVVVFHNEGWSPLLRTVHSVLNRSPSQLLEEVLLVDDFSSKEHLGIRLDEYIKQFDGRVRLIRNAERHGLIRSRSTGAMHAHGQVVIFLDAHCEANANWLPPLLAPIAANRKVMTVPLIDSINMYNWGYYQQYGTGSQFRGIFDWGLLYKETELPAKEKQRRSHETEPYNAPTHAGGLFAIDRQWFEELGYYDEGLQIWGGENFELSFKIWQCGGGVLFVPCSRVGHVYRNRMPYNFGKLSGPVISLNYKRVAEVWMDEYIAHYYTREPYMQRREAGDVTKQLELRKKMNCKSFKWFMDNIAYDVPAKYPLLPPNVVWGEARNKATGLCIDTMNQPMPGTMGVSGCHGLGGNQLFRLNAKGQMAVGEWCIMAVVNRLQTSRCKMGTVDGPWSFNEATQQILHRVKNVCVAVSREVPPLLTIQGCEEGEPLQQWDWKEIWI